MRSFDAGKMMVMRFTINVPEELANYLRRRVDDSGAASADDYIRQLIEEDRRLQEQDEDQVLRSWFEASRGEPHTDEQWHAKAPQVRQHLQTLIEVGINSGPGRVMQPQDWDALKQQVTQGHQGSSKA